MLRKPHINCFNSLQMELPSQCVWDDLIAETVAAHCEDCMIVLAMFVESNRGVIDPNTNI